MVASCAKRNTQAPFRAGQRPECVTRRTELSRGPPSRTGAGYATAETTAFTRARERYPRTAPLPHPIEGAATQSVWQCAGSHNEQSRLAPTSSSRDRPCPARRLSRSPSVWCTSQAERDGRAASKPTVHAGLRRARAPRGHWLAALEVGRGTTDRLAELLGGHRVAGRPAPRDACLGGVGAEARRGCRAQSATTMAKPSLCRRSRSPAPARRTQPLSAEVASGDLLIGRSAPPAAVVKAGPTGPAAGGPRRGRP